MTQDQSLQPIKKPKEMSPLVYKWAYGAFVVLAFYYIFLSSDFMAGVSNLGIALIFDPFNQKVKWEDRPTYQKVWLVIHLIMVAGLFIYGVWFR